MRTLNCLHGHYAGRCTNRHCNCPCHTARIGDVTRPDREWEVWNESFRVSVLLAKDYGTFTKPWSIWHPAFKESFDFILGDRRFDTLADALDQVAILESLYADLFYGYRNRRKR